MFPGCYLQLSASSTVEDVKKSFRKISKYCVHNFKLCMFIFTVCDIVSDIAVFVLKRNVKLQLTN